MKCKPDQTFSLSETVKRFKTFNINNAQVRIAAGYIGSERGRNNGFSFGYRSRSDGFIGWNSSVNGLSVALQFTSLYTHERESSTIHQMMKIYGDARHGNRRSLLNGKLDPSNHINQIIPYIYWIHLQVHLYYIQRCGRGKNDTSCQSQFHIFLLKLVFLIWRVSTHVISIVSICWCKFRQAILFR